MRDLKCSHILLYDCINEARTRVNRIHTHLHVLLHKAIKISTKRIKKKTLWSRSTHTFLQELDIEVPLF